MSLYRGLEVVENSNLIAEGWCGLYKDGKIYVRPGLEPDEYAITLEHEFQHHEAEKRHPLLAAMSRNHLNNAAGVILIAFHNPLGFALLAPFIWGMSGEEFNIFIEMRDFGASFFRRWTIVLLFDVFMAFMWLYNPVGRLLA